MGYLSPRALQGLKEYQYKPAGYTWLDDLHQPFWNALTEMLPMWLAPNLVTLSGLIGLVIAYFLDLYYDPNMSGNAPRWVHAFSGVAVLVYVHLDCVDGKQARRTKSSSPLGQLFDHGCDAVSLHLMTANLHCAINYPCNPVASIVLTSVVTCWVFGHWEEYHTGVLMYGNTWFGVLEANYSLAFAQFLTAAMGAGVWDTQVVTLPEQIPLPDALPRTWTLRHLFFASSIIMGMGIQLTGQLYRVFTFDDASLPAVERGNKELGLGAKLKHASIVTVMLVLGMLWTAESDVGWGQCRSASFNFGISYALIASQLITDHMCKEPFRPMLWPFAVLAAGALNTHLRLLDPILFSFACNVVVTAGYLHWVVTVVGQITKFLGIKCLTIPRAKAAQQ
ncbi:MAG: hypothetical protein WDW36_008656 [Sanguina aurantia]